MSEVGIYFFVISVIFIILLTAIFVFGYQYIKRQIAHRKEKEAIQRKNEAILLKATLQTQEMERERIGANLHDDIGPLLSSFKFYFKNELKTKEGEEKEEITAILEELDDKIEHVRAISREMVPNVLKNFGFKAAIEDFARRFEKDGSIQFTTKIPDNPQLDQETLLALYRIIQEASNNAIRHGKANLINIQMNDQNGFSVIIKDNGQGFAMDQLKPGLGLRNMEARAKAIDGILEVVSEVGKGTKITIKSRHLKSMT